MGVTKEEEIRAARVAAAAGTFLAASNTAGNAPAKKNPAPKKRAGKASQAASMISSDSVGLYKSNAVDP